MKILVVCGAGIVSGAEIVTLSLIRALRGKGHDVRCITSSWGNGDFAGRLNGQSVPYVRLPLGFISKTLSWSAIWMTVDQLLNLPKLWLGYRRYERIFHPDIVLQSNFHHLFLLWPLLDGGKTIFHVHNAFPSTRFHRRLFRLFSKRVAAYIGVSRFVADRIAELDVPARKVLCVPNGVGDAERSAMALTPHSFQTTPSRRDGPGETVDIGIVGQIGAWKGHDDLIDALRLIKSWNLPFLCLVYGQGEPEYIESLKAKIDKHDLGKQFVWKGYIENKSDIFHGIDICVVPSRIEEAFGMVAAEAAFFSIPVIATRTGGLPEVVKDGETGYLIDACSPRQIAERLSILIRDRALREKMGHAARQKALQQYTGDRMAGEMEAIFRTVVDRQKKMTK